MRHSCVRSSVRIVFSCHMRVLQSLQERWQDSVITSSALRQLRFQQVSAPVSVTMRKKYTGKENEAESGDEQFEIADNRSLQEIYDAIKDQGLQPVLNEYIYV